MIRFLKNNWIFILSSLLLIFPALFSKFPLVFSDSGTYINSSVTFIPPSDRPLGYGLFINVFSWKYTLWTVIIAQGIIASFLIWNMTLFILREKDQRFTRISFISVVILLAMASSLPWYASQIMPDIFIAYGAVATLLLFVKKEEKKWRYIAYILIILVSFMTHFSHFIILFLAMVVLIYLHRQYPLSPFHVNRKNKYKPLMVFILGIVSFLFMSITNYFEFKKFSPSMGTYVFLTGRLAESGILERYLDDQCDKGEVSYPRLCEAPDRYKSTTDLIWSGDGVLAQNGWDWVKADSALKPLFYDIMSNPEYFFYFSFDCAKNTMIQMFQVNIGGGLDSYREGSAAHFAVDNHLWAEKNYFLDSKQSYDLLKLDFFRVFNYFLIVLTIFLFAFYFIYNRLKNDEAIAFKFLFLCYFFNAMVTASLANVYDRLQARITWPLVLIAILVLIRIIYNYLSKRSFNSVQSV